MRSKKVSKKTQKRVQKKDLVVIADGAIVPHVVRSSFFIQRAPGGQPYISFEFKF